MDEVIFKTFPVSSKAYSGFFRLSRNGIPYTLVLSKSCLTLKLIGIPVIKIDFQNITNFRYVGSEWVATQRVFNGVVITHDRSGKTKERVISIFRKNTSSAFLAALRGVIGEKEIS